MKNIGLGFRRVERIEMTVDADPLPELPHFRRSEHFLELRLSDKDDLEELCVLGLQVGQHPDFLKELRRKILRLVDDENREVFFTVLLDEERVEVAKQGHLVLAGDR